MRAVDSLEFTAWVEFFRQQPFGPQASDLRMGTLAALLRGAYFTGPIKAPADFALGIQPTPRRQTGADLRSMFRGFAERDAQRRT